MKRIIIWSICAAVVLIGGPGITSALPKEYSFATSILLFFTVDPVFAFVTGLFSGCDIRQLWWTSLATGALFLCGVWIFIAPLNLDFLIYAAFYVAVSAIVMAFTAAIRNRWQAKKERQKEKERKGR